MSSRSRSNSASSASSSSSESDHDNTEQLLEAARKAAAAKTTTSHGLDAQADLVSLGSSKPIAPVASTSKVAAVPRELPQDNFGQLPRKHLSKKQYRATQEKSAGRNWFDMPAAPKEPSEELKREVAALKLGAAIDPKRFLRGEAKRDAGKLPEYFQMGHVLASDHPASTERRGPGKAGKKRSFVEEIAEDQQVRDYTKRKFGEVQHKTSSGGKNYYKSRQSKRTGGKSGVKRK